MKLRINLLSKGQRAIGMALVAALTLTLATVACGGAAAPTPTSAPSPTATRPVGQGTAAPAPTQDPSATATPLPTPVGGLTALSGDIEIDGSSTVFPVTEAMAEEFGGMTRGKVRVTVGISGTGGGFKKFCNGETDISDASRPIKGSEDDACVAKGIEYIELPVAIDGLTVVVNHDNTFASCMTVAELKKLWEPAAEGTVTRWNQIRPEWPNEPIRLYGPGVDSGTFDYFTEVVNGEAQSSRGDFTASEDDNVLVQGVAGDKNALGYFGYAYYEENASRLKVVEIDGGKGCVGPAPDTINNGTYAPLSRPIFIYSRKDSAAMPHIKEFVRYYLSKESRPLISEVGYIPFRDRVYELALARFESGKAGAIFGGHSPKQGSVEEVLTNN